MSNYKSKTTVYEKKADGSLFPLGQVVPNIDERVRKLENFPSAVVVTKPTISGSSIMPDMVGSSIKLTVYAEALLQEGIITKFDFWLNNDPPSTQIAEENTAIITILTPTDAQVGDTFNLYVRAYDNFGSSNINSTVLTVVSSGVVTPSLTGKTEDVKPVVDVFSGSEFTMIGVEGTHDKSDWVIVKKGAETVEVWSSKDDTEHLTTSPSLPRDVLETSTTYIIKVRYHDSNNDIWSDWGQLEFTTSNLFGYGEWDPIVPTQGIHFTAYYGRTDFNIFKTTLDNCEYEVWINNEKTDQNYTSITFESGADVLIKCVSGGKFPVVKWQEQNWVKAIVEPFPTFYVDNDTVLTDATEFLYNVPELTSLPDYLFGNNPKITNFERCFYGTSHIITIPNNLFASNTEATSFKSCFSNTYTKTLPADLFRNNTKATDFSNCFGDCGLTEVPAGLFENNTAITTVEACFEGCGNLTTIPENLFSNCVNLTNADRIFEGCRSLTTIPENLFGNHPSLTRLIGTFRATGLTTIPERLLVGLPNIERVYTCFYNTEKHALMEIPENLFANNTNITDFSSCFSGFNGTTIPENLFANNTKAENFNDCFRESKNLTTVPQNLFINNPNIDSLNYTFKACPQLTVNLRIVSENVTSASEFALGTKSVGTVYVPIDSQTVTTFRLSTKSGVNYIEE